MTITFGTLLTLGLFVVGQDAVKQETDQTASSRKFRASVIGSEWCAPAYGVHCRSSGTECQNGVPVADLVDSPTNTGGYTDFCVCKDGYDKYISPVADGERCRAVPTVDPADAECEIDEDCSAYGGSGGVVCRLEGNKPVGHCACASGYIYDLTQSTCRSYDCSTDGDGKCREDFGLNAVCHTIARSVAVCACKTGFMMLSDPTQSGRQQCRELANYRCDNSSNLCPSSGVNALYCDVSGRCACPRNTVITTVPATGLSECRSLTIGAVGCITDKNCPENAFCQKSNNTATGICLCKDYFRMSPTSVSHVVKCQLAVGTGCRTRSDCGEMHNVNGVPLVCVRPTAGGVANQRGICVCQGVGTTAWGSDRCLPASC